MCLPLADTIICMECGPKRERSGSIGSGSSKEEEHQVDFGAGYYALCPDSTITSGPGAQLHDLLRCFIEDELKYLTIRIYAKKHDARTATIMLELQHEWDPEDNEYKVAEQLDVVVAYIEEWHQKPKPYFDTKGWKLTPKQQGEHGPQLVEQRMAIRASELGPISELHLAFEKE